MLDGQAVVRALVACGITHVVWIPDSTTGAWDHALSNRKDLELIRVCREGEAFGVAAGLLVAGKSPVIVIQCTGLFEAGDSLRNFVHDLGLPLLLIVGLRDYANYVRGKSADTAAVFAERILTAWQVPFTIIAMDAAAEDLALQLRRAQAEGRAAAVLLAE